MVSGKKNVVSENYDEIVFTDPTNTMYHLLTNPKPMVPAIRHEPGMDCESDFELSGRVQYSTEPEGCGFGITEFRARVLNTGVASLG